MMCLIYKSVINNVPLASKVVLSLVCKEMAIL